MLSIDSVFSLHKFWIDFYSLICNETYIKAMLCSSGFFDQLNVFQLHMSVIFHFYKGLLLEHDKDELLMVAIETFHVIRSTTSGRTLMSELCPAFTKCTRSLFVCIRVERITQHVYHKKKVLNLKFSIILKRCSL